jgi:hypothetical protein
MVAVALKCPFCGSEDVRSYGTANGKKRYACNNPACSHKTCQIPPVKPAACFCEPLKAVDV